MAAFIDNWKPTLIFENHAGIPFTLRKYISIFYRENYGQYYYLIRVGTFGTSPNACVNRMVLKKKLWIVSRFSQLTYEMIRTSRLPSSMGTSQHSSTQP